MKDDDYDRISDPLLLNIMLSAPNDPEPVGRLLAVLLGYREKHPGEIGVKRGDYKEFCEKYEVAVDRMVSIFNGDVLDQEVNDKLEAYLGLGDHDFFMRIQQDMHIDRLDSRHKH